jgi:RNA-directed DNA polymerase
VDKAKPFDIPKQEVWEAYKSVRANRGAAGVDGQSIAEFEADLEDNLYKLWNRLSSGSYFPPPVRRVDIPKGEGKTRPLGIPTVADRIAQTVVKRYLEPLVEPVFHEDSYGYRPGKSAHDALGVARQRCWRYAWVLDLDIRNFFESIDRDKLMAAVRKHTDCRWALLYIERWLKAPVQLGDGSLVERERGTPQGGVISPLLANLFLHYVFDAWMRRKCPGIPFERYADDAICHCRSKAQALWLREALEKRFAACGLELHPEKTKIVFCKEDNRPGNYPNQSFDFLGYTFRPRLVKWKEGEFGVGFTPAIGNKALKEIRQTVRRWAFHRHSEWAVEGLAELINPPLRGWINYYGRFNKSALHPIFTHIDARLARWALWKFKALKGSRVRAYDWLVRLRRRKPDLFAHWQLPEPVGRTMGAV